MQPSTSPVFAVGGTRLTPQTASGINLMISEIKGLDLEAGHFYSSTSQDQTNRDGELWATYAGVSAKSIDFAGGRYAVTDRLTLSFQKFNGNTPFDYIGGGDNNRVGNSMFLANSIQYSDFNGPGEKSWQARYDLSMAPYGVPGLSIMTRYANGFDIDGSHTLENSPYASE